jgi:hypothetical protein
LFPQGKEDMPYEVNRNSDLVFKKSARHIFSFLLSANHREEKALIKSITRNRKDEL